MRIPKLLRLITISIFLSRRARVIPAAANATIHFDMRKIRFRTESLCDEKPTDALCPQKNNFSKLLRIDLRASEHSPRYTHTPTALPCTLYNVFVIVSYNFFSPNHLTELLFRKLNRQAENTSSQCKKTNLVSIS